MSGKTLFDDASPKTQSIDAVKALLTWRGRETDPMPQTVEFTHESGEGRLMLILSNKKDGYYTTTSSNCSCPARTYNPGQPCKHMRYPQEARSGSPGRPQTSSGPKANGQAASMARLIRSLERLNPLLPGGDRQVAKTPFMLPP